MKATTGSVGFGRRAAVLATVAMALPHRGAAAAVPFAMAEIAPGIHVRQGVHEDATPGNADAIANIGFIIGDDSVAILDPGGSRIDGQRLRASVRALTDRPIRHVILSHMHPDHVFGCIAFADDRPVFVAHANILPALAARGAYDRRALADIVGSEEAGDYATPDWLVTGLQTLDLGNRVLELRAHGTAHTDNDLSVVDRQTGTLWAGDLLFVDRIPALDGNLTGWLHEIAVLQALSCDRAVPGHGPPSVAWPAGAADELRYLTLLRDDTRAMIARGAAIEDAPGQVARTERNSWLLFEQYNARNAIIAFKELEWE